MNTVKFTKCLIMFLFIAFSANTYAANAYSKKSKIRADEVDVKSIKLADDRTGIIKDVSCFGCDFHMVKITKKTKATSKGLPVDILEVKRLKDVVVGVSFNLETREVLSIDW